MIKTMLKKFRMFVLLNTKYSLLKNGKNFYCGKSLIIRPKTVSIGNDVFIGSYCHLAVKELIIEDYVMLAPRVSIVGGDHRFDIVGTPCRYTGRDIEKSVIIKKDVWIGFGSIILHGVTIGEGSIVGAGSLVTHDVEPYTIVVGRPARKVRNRFLNEDDKNLHHKMLKNFFK